MTRACLTIAVTVAVLMGVTAGFTPVRADEPETPLVRTPGKAAKRVAPPEIAPVTVGGVKIEALHWGRERGLGQNGGYVVAVDPATGKELWTLKIYDVTYDGAKEEDVQDVFIASMRAVDDRHVEIVDENGRSYLLDVTSRDVTPQ